MAESHRRTGELSPEVMDGGQIRSNLVGMCRLTKCPSCTSVFDRIHAVPKVLNCGHTACLDCLRKPSSPSSIACPTCGVALRFTVGVTDLPTNESVLGLIDICCEVCWENPKVEPCEHCEKIVCKICLSIHKKIFKESTMEVMGTLQILHDDTECSISCSNEKLLNHHMQLKNVIIEQCGQMRKKIDDHQEATLQKLDQALATRKSKHAELQRIARAQVKSSNDLINVNQQKMKKPSFVKMKNVQDMCNMYCDRLRKTISSLDNPGDLLCLSKKEITFVVYGVASSPAAATTTTTTTTTPTTPGTKRSLDDQQQEIKEDTIKKIKVEPNVQGTVIKSEPIIGRSSDERNAPVDMSNHTHEMVDSKFEPGTLEKVQINAEPIIGRTLLERNIPGNLSNRLDEPKLDQSTLQQLKINAITSGGIRHANPALVQKLKNASQIVLGTPEKRQKLKLNKQSNQGTGAACQSDTINVIKQEMKSILRAKLTGKPEGPLDQWVSRHLSN